MSKSPKVEASPVAFTTTEQAQEGNNERFAHKFNSKFVPKKCARSINYCNCSIFFLI